MERFYVGCDRKGNESLNSNNNNNNNNGTGRREITGLTRITKKRLKELCKKDKLYQTPALNDVLYLHYQGIDCIECLEEYTGLKCLWLECNAISEIQGLDNQKQLKCLFLQSNLIKRIENLENCPELDTLNLASNHIRKIENCGFDVLPVLSTLNLASNFLKDFDGLKDLENCKTLSVLDLSNNRIDDILVVKIFAKMPQLRVLVLQGNPVVSKLPQYRKTLILECKELTYLDSRPVFPKDRACAEAWKAGGYEGERKENDRWNRMERKKIRDSVNATIRMRNKHKPPDQQDALFNSSDSEEDLAESKRQRQAEIDAGINMELGIWEEVVNEDSKSETSSDMNISSSTSGLSTTDSNANISADSKSIELRANMNKDEKITNTSPQQKAQVLEIARDANMGEILKVVNTKAPESKESESKELIFGQKRVFIEEIEKPSGDQASGEVSEIASCVVERLLDKEIIPAVVEKATHADRHSNVVHNLSDSDDATTKDEYNATVDAICKITMNDLSTPSPKKRIKLQIEVDETLDEEQAEQPGEMLEETMEIKEQEVSEITEEDASESVPNKEKTAEQIKYEQECEKVNQKVMDDFEELSTHMDNFIEEMQQSNEKMNEIRTAAAGDESLMDEAESETESSGSSQTEMEEHLGNLQLLQRERSPEKRTASVIEHVARVEGLVSFEPSQMHTNGDASGERESEECGNRSSSGSGSGSDVPPEASTLEKVNLPQQLATNLEPIHYDVPGDHANMPALINEPTNVDGTEKADTGNENNAPMVQAPDFSRPQATANAAHEREERELRQLLQKLEDENEQLYKINDAYRRVLEEDIREEIKYRDDKKSDENSEKMCEEIIDEMLDELTILDRRPIKPKSYEFGEIESDEEYSYSDPPKPPEPPVRTIRDVLGSFNELLQEIARKNREELERKERELNEALRRKHASTEAEKAASLQNLLNSPNLRDFNGDTNESLDQQIAGAKKRETERVRKIVDRVYAQKDKYNDTLEVVDGKLVVVKKDTGEIEELPESKCNYSDSEDTDAYESANSDNEAAGTEAPRLWDAKVRREENASGSFRLPYRPTERKSAMKLIQEANELKEKEEAEREEAEEGDEDGTDKFYSLEPTKPAAFRNIDEEFIEKLDFEKAELEKQDEDEHKTETVECARSYTDLKQMMKANKEDLNLTDDENAMLQKMLGRAEKDEAAKRTADPFTAEENELLHKMVQRTKEKEKEKEAKRLEAEAVRCEAGARPTLSKQTIKIMEFNNNNNNSNNNSNTEEEGADAEQAGNFMNIKQLNAEFPIPRAFRDMLDDYDLGTMTRYLAAGADPPELTLLYSKEYKKKAEAMSDGGVTEVVVCGNFENPLQLSRGGITLTTHYEGEEEEEEDFKEVDTSYDDALPATDEDELAAACETLEEQNKEHADPRQTSPDNGTSNEKRELISEVAASVLKFDGTNYAEYGIDRETARGVVAYEKMLNFGYEQVEEEFVDASMQAEEMEKIVTEALQKDQLMEKGKGDGVAGEELKALESSKTGGGAGLNESRAKQALVKPRVYFAEFLATDDAANKACTKQLVKQCDEERKPPSDDIEFQDLSEEYKDFPVVGSMSAETIAATVSEVDEIATKSPSNTTVFQDFVEDEKDSTPDFVSASMVAVAKITVVDKNYADAAAKQESPNTTEFRELSEDSREFPPMSVGPIETIEAAAVQADDVNSADVATAEQTTKKPEFQDLAEDYRDLTLVESHSPDNIATTDKAADSQDPHEALADTTAIKQPTTTKEFQELYEHYKDLPLPDGSLAETNEAAGIGAKTQHAVEVENSTAPTPNAPSTPDLTLKHTSTELEKRRSLQNLLKSPILKQFNDDTNESLDAQILAANEEDDDFDIIECNLQVIDDNDEVIKEIAVNAEITYST